VRAAGKLCVPVLISVASYQLHFIFGHSIALRFNTSAVMDYAQELVLVFILTIVYAIAAVYFPKLSVLWAKADSGGYNESLRNALLYTMFLVLPAASGFFILRFEIMEFLLGWGGYTDYESVRLAGNLMGLYAVGVIAISFKEVADRAFYSGKDSKTPAIFGVLIMVVNIAAVVLLIPALGAYAMPVAYGIAAAIGGGGLIFKLNLKTRFIGFPFVYELCKTLAAVVIMTLVSVLARELLRTDILIVDLVVPVVFGVVAYFAVAFALKISAFSALRGGFK
jgi:putative peptidoglycan lipid II flippase